MPRKTQKLSDSKQNKYLLPNIRVKEYFENFIKYLPGSIYCKDVNGKYLACSDYLIYEANLLSTQDVVGKTDYELFPKEQADILRKNDEEVMARNKFVITEEVVTLPMGTQKFYEVVKAPWRDDKGSIIGIIGNSIDITKRKMIEQDLREAKEKAEVANEAKTAFIQNMEHDLRTPSSGVAQMIHMLEEKEINPEKKELLHHVGRASKQLLELINGILEFDKFSQQESPVLFKKFDVQELISNVIDIEYPAARSKNIELIFKCAPNMPEILVGDNTRLYRILLNLISNAVKFTPKGFVKIIAQVAQEIDQKKILLKFEIQDTGIGIPADKQNIIYERFTRCTPSNQGLYPGSGLGLSIVRQLVTDLEGEIEVESELGKGTTFTCLLPFERPLLDVYINTQKKEKAIVAHSQQDKTQFNILLVEDDLLAQKITTSLLENDGQNHVDLAKTGEEAMSAAQSKQYDIIFMDLGLPDASGYEVAKKIRGLGIKEIPIIALTAHNASFAGKSAKEAGMNDLITKPLTADNAQWILNKWGRGISEEKKSETKSEKQAEKTERTKKESDVSQKVIDLELGEKLAGGNKVMAFNMLKMLVTELPETKNKMIQVYHQEKNLKKLGDVVHKLHGGASYCGTSLLKEAAKNLEVAARNGKTNQINELFEQLMTEIDLLMHEYKTLKK